MLSERFVESLQGTGDLRHGKHLICEDRYNLQVVQTFLEGEPQHALFKPKSLLKRIEGQVEVPDEIFLNHKFLYALKLPNERRLLFSVVPRKRGSHVYAIKPTGQTQIGTWGHTD